MAIQEERFSLGENSERMVTVTPFMGKLKIHIRQFYVNGNGEIKPGKSGIVLDLKEFDKLVELIPQIKESIERYELKDSEIPSSPFQLDLPVLDLDSLLTISTIARTYFNPSRRETFWQSSQISFTTIHQPFP